MNQFLLALIATIVLLTGCASSGGGSASSAQDNSGLPEIAAYEDEAYDPLPDMIANP